MQAFIVNNPYLIKEVGIPIENEGLTFFKVFFEFVTILFLFYV